MRLPRDLSGAQLIKGLRNLGYVPTRQTGSHARLTTQHNGQHHITVPLHDPLRAGTLAAILTEVANHHQIDRDELINLVQK
jgi:predicted RNA binding protein YcfA (HicA-like mRNA interferase family)